MTAHNTGRASLRDWSVESCFDRICLCGGRDHAYELVAGEESGDGQGHCILRNLLKSSKTSVVNLLGAAGEVEVNLLDSGRVIEIGHVRIVEGNVTILSYTHKADVDVMLFENLVVSLDGIFGITLGSDVVNRSKVNL